jgi:hypothetical protein
MALIVAVPVGAMCAPFLHAHVDDDDHDHPHATSVHAHFAPHPIAHAEHEGINIEERDHDRAFYLQVFVAVQPAVFEIPTIAASSFTLTAPPERPAHIAVEVAHGLDPPLADALDSRPPPLFLS